MPMNKSYALQNVNEVSRSYKNFVLGAFKNDVLIFGIGILERMSNVSAALWQRMAQRADLFIPRSQKVLNRISVDETAFVHSMADTVFASNVV